MVMISKPMVIKRVFHLMLPQEAGGMVVELPLEADGLELLLEAGGVELPHPGRPAHRHLPPTLAVCK